MRVQTVLLARDNLTSEETCMGTLHRAHTEAHRAHRDMVPLEKCLGQVCSPTQLRPLSQEGLQSKSEPARDCSCFPAGRSGQT